MSNKSFFCSLPWTHLNVNPNGTVNPCCFTTDIYQLGLVKDSDLKDLWNSEAQKDLRKKMLAGEVPDPCKLCHLREQSGFITDRIRANEYFGDLSVEVSKTMPDGSLPDFNLKSLDVRFSNYCNLSCRICRPISSTSWYTDAKLLGFNHVDLTKKITPTPGNKKLMAEIMPLLKNLNRIFFVGGEPLLQKEHYLVLEELLAIGNHKILLDYISNFTELSFGPYSVIDLWRKFEQVSVHISLDGMEERGELLRKGMDWKRLVENIKRVRLEVPHLDLKVSATISIHNVFHLSDFLKRLVVNLDFSPMDIKLAILSQPSYYSLQTLPQIEKNKVKNELGLLMDYFSQNFNSQSSSYMKHQISAIVNFMNEGDNSSNFKHFISMTKRLDFIRSEDYSTLFPEFSQYF